MGLRNLGEGFNPKASMVYLFFPVVMAGALIASIAPTAEWFPHVEAQAAMLASPPPAIDGHRAFGYLEQVVAIGPRTAGSAANTKQRKLVADHFAKAGGKVREQPFGAVHPLTGEKLEMANLIGSWNPDRLERVVIGAHYDTRPFPDQEERPNRRKLPFVGANDGGSGVALLMEIANHLTTLDTPWGVDLVLFDGEELVYGNQFRKGEYFLGSDEFARVYTVGLRDGSSRSRYVAGIVLDMVGGRNLRIKREPNSLEAAPELVNHVWAVAQSLRIRAFSREMGREVMDDHLALIRAGIPTIDIIDFEYPYWHKADDIPSKCSAQSLADVGRVVTTWLMQPPAVGARR
jgi:hypothetical protein